MLELLDYWAQEPPAHVILAMRYLGQAKGRKGQPSEEQAKTDMQQLGGFLGQSPKPLPAHLKQMILDAEKTKQEHKGI